MGACCSSREGAADEDEPLLRPARAGQYRVIHDGTTVTQTSAVTSRDVGKLKKGATVTVLEVAERLAEGRVRGRLAAPNGWISLRETDSNRAWAVRVDGSGHPEATPTLVAPEPAKPTKALAGGAVVEAGVVGLCVALALYVLSWLDSHPMPYLQEWFKLKDVKFYFPPHAAVAAIFFATPSLPKLRQVLVGLIVAATAAIAVVELAETQQLQALEPVHVRCLAAAAAVFAMKVAGTVFPPAAAVAVLFADNVAFKASLGRAYVLMPGLSGTLVLFVLASAKLAAMDAMKGGVEAIR